MKKYSLIAAIWWGGVALLSGCSKEAEADGMGRADFACLPDIAVEEMTRATAQLPIEVPAAADFKLTVANADGSYSEEYEHFRDYDQPLMKNGEYVATFSLGDPDAENSTAYCFEGSTAFKVTANRTTPVTVRPKLTNSAVRLSTTEWFDNYYSSAEFTVTTASGNSFHFTPTSGQTIFVKAGTTLKLKGSAVKAQNGVEVTFPETAIGTAAASALHTITVDASKAGGGVLILSLGTEEDMMEVAPVEIELNPEA